MVYSRILPFYCYYSHASLAIMLKLCSFRSWENTLKPLCTMSCICKLWHWRVPAIHLAAVSECHCLHAGHCLLDSLSWINWLHHIDLLPRDDLLMHLAIIPACCFALQLLPHYAQHHRLKPSSYWVLACQQISMVPQNKLVIIHGLHEEKL